MSDRKIEIVISASDDYSAAMRKFNNAVGDMDGAVQKASDGTRKLNRAIGDLSDVNDWAAGGVKKLKNIFEGFAFGGALGIVSGGISAFTQLLIESYQSAAMTSDKLSTLNSELVQQATSWNLIPSAVGGATDAVIRFYNARLALAQFEGTQRKAEIIEEIKHYEQLQKNYEFNAKAFPQREDLARKAKEYTVTLAGLRIELEGINAIEALAPTTFEKVANATAPAKKGLKGVNDELDAFKSRILDLPDSTFLAGSLSALFGAVNLSIGKIDPMMQAYNAAGDNKGGGMTAIERMEADLQRLEQMGSPKTLGQVGAPREFSEAVQLNSRLQEMQKYYEDRLDLMSELGRSEVEINEVKNQQILAQEQQLSYLKMSLAQGSFAMMSNTMQNLTVLIGKEGGAAFKAMKAFAIAETTIQTYRAAMGSYAALAPIPVVGPALAIAAATAATIAGMARVKQIASMEPGGTASGTTVGPDGAANPSYSGGSPNSYPVPTRTEEKAPISVTLIVNTLDGKDVNWPRIMEENILPTMEKISGDGNRPINIRVAQA